MKSKEVLLNLLEKENKLFFDKVFGCLARFIINDLKKYNDIAVFKNYSLEKNISLRDIIVEFPYVFISHFGDEPLLLILDSAGVKFLFDYILHAFNRDILKKKDPSFQDKKIQNNSSDNAKLTDIEYRILRMFTNHIFKSVVNALKFRVSKDYKPVVCDLKDNETIYLTIDKGCVFKLNLTVNNITSLIRIFMPNSFVDSLLVDFNVNAKSVKRNDTKKINNNRIDKISIDLDFLVRIKELTIRQARNIKLGDRILLSTKETNNILMENKGLKYARCSLGKSENKIAVKIQDIFIKGD